MGLSQFEDPCCAQGKRSYSASFEVEPKQPRKKTKKNGTDSGFSSTPPQFSSSSSESESELSDFQIQPRPTSHLLSSRRLSQHSHPSIDYGKLSESAGDLDTNEDEDDDDDLDVEYVDPTACYSRARVPPVAARAGVGRGRGVGAAMGKKRRSRPRVEQLKRKYHATDRGVAMKGEERGRKGVEQKRNISSLFQPQSPLINENMKVCVCIYTPL